MGALAGTFGFGFGDPGIGGGSGFPTGLPPTPPVQSSSSDSGSSAQSWLRTIFPFLQLGTQTYLAQDALNQSRPSTLTYDRNGNPVVSGGGAAFLPSGSSFASYMPLIIIVVILVLLVRK